MMALRFLQVAEDELTAAGLWYNREQRGLGDRFLEAVVVSRRRIEADPSTLPRSEHYRGPRDIRRCPVEGFPYQMIFEIRQV